MAAGNFCICVLLALAAGNLIMAEEEKAWPMSINPMDFFNMFFGGSDSSRSKRAAEENQARFFLPYFASCNYSNSSQAGSQCRDCNTAVRCYPSNVGLVRQCRGFLPYCNNGRCSSQPGPLCNSGSSSSNSSSTNSSSTNSSSTNSTSG